MHILRIANYNKFNPVTNGVYVSICMSYLIFHLKSVNNDNDILFMMLCILAHIFQIKSLQANKDKLLVNNFSLFTCVCVSAY